jgi:capsular polysaccharide biosynthesis protein/predicted nucleic acid-binding protein
VHDRVSRDYLPGIDIKTTRKNVVGDIGIDSFLHVLAYAKTREESAMLANAFASAFEDEMQEMLAAGPKRTLAVLKTEGEKAWKSFETLSAELVHYLEGTNFTNVEVEAGNMLAQRQAVQRQIEMLELQHSSNLAQRPVYKQLVESRPEFVVTGQSLSENSVYKSALERSSQLATELALKKIERTDKHPEIVRLTNELLMVQARMSQQAEMTHSSSTMSQDPQALSFMQKMVEIDIAEASYDSQKTIFEQTVSKLDSELQSVPGYRVQVTLISAKILQARNHAEDIAARHAELDFHIKHGFRFTISNEFTVAKPEKALALPTPVGIMIFSTLAGLIVGILAAVVSELVKQLRLRSPY